LIRELGVLLTDASHANKVEPFGSGDDINVLGSEAMTRASLSKTSW
jgi:hypothetical protein